MIVSAIVGIGNRHAVMRNEVHGRKCRFGSVYLQHAEDIAGGVLVHFHVRAGALLARVNDHLAPVLRDGSAGAGSARLRRTVGDDGKVWVAVVGRRRRRGRDGGVKSGLGLEMRLRLEGPDIDDRIRRPLADGIQSLPLSPHILGIGLVRLLGMIQRAVAIAGLIGIIVEQTRRLRLGRLVAVTAET